MQTPTNLICEVEDAKLAVNIDLAEWTFNELIDYVFASCQPNLNLKINGEIIDGTFHLSLSSLQGSNQNTSKLEISNLIQFNSTPDENPELPIGLKIVKKIVEIYDGLFLMSDIDQGEISVYLTLPLVSDLLPSVELQSQPAAISSQSLD